MNVHKEIDSLVMTDEDIARIIHEFEIRTTKDLEIFLRKAGFSPENLLETPVNVLKVTFF